MEVDVNSETVRGVYCTVSLNCAERVGSERENGSGNSKNDSTYPK